VHVVDLGVRQGVQNIPKLVGVHPHVEVGDHTRDVLAVEVVVGAVHVADTPVGVVVAVGAGAERALCPQRRSLPVLVVVRETVHLHVRLAMILLLGVQPSPLLPLELEPFGLFPAQLLQLLFLA